MNVQVLHLLPAFSAPQPRCETFRWGLAACSAPSARQRQHAGRDLCCCPMASDIDVLFGDDKNELGPRCDVVKGVDFIVLIHLARGRAPAMISVKIQAGSHVRRLALEMNSMGLWSFQYKAP